MADFSEVFGPLDEQTLGVRVETSGLTEFIGFTRAAVPDTSKAEWLIKRIVSSSGGKNIVLDYAQGSQAFDQIFDDRASLFPPGGGFENLFSLNFDGINDFLDGGDILLFDNDDAFTFSFWVKPTNFSGQGVLYSKTTVAPDIFGIILTLTTLGELRILMRASGQLGAHSFTGNLTAGVWNHVVWTYDGSQNMNGSRGYIDGVVQDTPSSLVITNTLLFGQDSLFGERDGLAQYLGNMDEITIFNVAANQTQVTEIFNSGAPGDPQDLAIAANLVSHYRCGDNDVFPVITDNEGSNDLAMTNMNDTDFEMDTP